MADAVTKAAKRAARRLKLEVTHVWVMESGWAYDGSEIHGVYVDAEIAKSKIDREWILAPDGESWTTVTDPSSTGQEFWMSKHPIITN